MKRHQSVASPHKSTGEVTGEDTSWMRVRLIRVATCVSLVATMIIVASGPATSGSVSPPPTSQLASEPRNDQRGDGWRVELLPDGGAQVSWVSPSRLPVTSDRPEILLDGKPLGPTVVMDDGRTVALSVTLPTAPNAADLDVELSGRLLDDPIATSAVPAPVEQPHHLGPVLADNPAGRGPYEVDEDDYVLPSIDLPGIEAAEVVGHVVAPRNAPGRRPVVMIIHGRHGWCYDPRASLDDHEAPEWPCADGQIPVPNHLGYGYLQEALASHGYFTVSISANAISAQDGDLPDSGMAARALLIRHHLRALGDLAALGISINVDVDMNKVVLVGHSRGGEGVNRASATIQIEAKHRIVGQVLLAPTNFARQATPYVPTVTMLPYCDGDVSNLEGQLYTDRARDLAADDTSPHTTVVVMGANHNFFNTEWTPGLAASPAFDDNGDTRGHCAAGRPTRLNASAQRKVALAYVVAAARYFNGEAQFWPLFDGSGARAPSTADFDIRTHAVLADRDLRRPGGGTALEHGAEARVCNGRQTLRRACISPRERWATPHWTSDGFDRAAPTARALAITWDAEGDSAGLSLARPADLSDDRYLDTRVLLPRGAAAQFGVRITDQAGRSQTVTPLADGQVAAMPTLTFGGGYPIAQTLRVDLDDVDTTVDLSNVASIELTAKTASGRVWVLDFAGVPDGVPPDPELTRLPILDAGQLRITETDGRSVARLPFQLSSPLADPATITAIPAPDDQGRSISPATVTLPAGAMTGSVPLTIPGNKIDNLKRYVSVFLYAARGVVVGHHYGRLIVRDDDPRPRLTLRALQKRVPEGDTIVFEVKWEKPVGYGAYFEGHFIRAQAPMLRVADVSKAYLDVWVQPRDRDPKRRLAGTDYPLSGQILAGDRVLRLRLPTVRDNLSEPPESVALMVSLPIIHRTRTARAVLVGRR